jgi:hypothetical protein
LGQTLIKFIFPWRQNDDYLDGTRPMGKWLCIDGFMFMDVGIRVMFDQCLGNRDRCSLEPSELKELVVQHINPNLQ